MEPKIINLYAFTLGYCESLTADITEDEMRHVPVEGGTSPAWTLGHLGLVSDMALGLLGQEKRLPESWGPMFGPGSSPADLGANCPSKEELMTSLRDGHAAVTSAAVSADAARLAAPNPLNIPMLVKAFPTVGDFLAHLLSTHEAMHLGQLSSWRRQTGRPSLF